MAAEKLTPKENAVFRAIAEQSKQYPDEPFVYKVKEGQLFLNSMPIAIDRTEHINIIHNLADRGIIEADWLVVSDIEDTFPGAGFCDLALGKEWAKPLYSSYTFLENPDDINDYIFINIHPSEIEEIRGISGTVCKANLESDKDPLAVSVHCESNKINASYTIHAFRDESRSSKIVFYAMEPDKLGDPVYRDELIDAIKKKNGKDAIKPGENIRKIFLQNRTICDVLGPIVELKSNYILIKKDAKLTRSQFELIKENADSIRVIQ